MSLLAPELYSIALGLKSGGTDECHWCGAKCRREIPHDDFPAVPGYYRSVAAARRPGNCYVCVGCSDFRRPRTTVNFLAGGFRDSQSPRNHSWWITEKGVWTLREQDYPELWNLLLQPPLRFVLAFKNDPNIPNHIHLMTSNDNSEVKADTPLTFTLNSIPHTFTIYELNEVSRSGSDGKSSGVRALLNIMGVPKFPDDPKRGRGRPTKEESEEANNTKKVITAKSGS